MEMLEFVLLLLAAVLGLRRARPGHPARVVAVGADRVGRRRHLAGGHARRRGNRSPSCSSCCSSLHCCSTIAACKQTWAVGQQGGHRVPCSRLGARHGFGGRFRAELARALHPACGGVRPGCGVGAHDAVAVSALARISICPAVRNPCSPARRSSTTHRASCRSSSP